MSEIPPDLVALPTSPWPERPAELPLVVAEVRTALWRTRGNITKAADLLKVDTARLRRFIKGSRFLSAEMEEAKEQVLDIAEENLVDALTDETDPGRRDSMTRYVLSTIGRTRGFGNAGGKGISINPTGSGRLQITWDDGTTIQGEPGDDAKVINADD